VDPIELREVCGMMTVRPTWSCHLSISGCSFWLLSSRSMSMLGAAYRKFAGSRSAM
jgi:hypothetical protein